MKKLNRSLVASAILVAMAAPAMASSSYNVVRVPALPVLAHEIFGDNAAESNGQANNILVKAPNVSVTLNPTALPTLALDGDVIEALETATIQFTLNEGVTFGEDLSTTAKLAAGNGGNGVLFGVTGDGVTKSKLIPATDAAGRAITAAGYTYNGMVAGAAATADAISVVVFEVIQGGSPTDNNITLKFRRPTDAEVTALDGAAAVAAAKIELESFTFGDYQVNDLVDALGNVGGVHAVKLSNEYTPAGLSADADDVLDDKETVAGATILASAPLLTVNATPSTYSTIAPLTLRYISVASDQKAFTEVPNDNLFDASDDEQFVNLGTLQVRRTVVCGAAAPGCDVVKAGAAAAPGQIIMGEDLNDYSFTADDVVSVVLDNVVLPTNHPYQGVGGQIYLDEVGSDCSDGVNATLIGATEKAALNSTASTATFTLTGNTTSNIELVKQVCFVANGVNRIPVQSQTINANATFNPINARYDNSTATDGQFGPLVLDGCTASFFNVPLSNNTNGDLAYLRLSNTSATDSQGGVQARLFKMNGDVVTGTGTDSEGFFTIGTELAQHATGVYTSAAADVVDANGRTVAYSIPKAAGIDGATIDALGIDRLRLVAYGAFPYCEGLGLIRTANGNVVNMTATTQGNGDAQDNDLLLNRGNNTH